MLRAHHFRDHQAAFILQWQEETRCRPLVRQRSRSRSRSRKRRPSAPAAAAAVEFVVRRVPTHLSERHAWPELLTQHDCHLTDQLVLHDSPVTQVLSKFERLKFIHTYIPAGTSASDGSSTSGKASTDSGGGGSGEPKGASPPPWQMRFNLPRSGLEFELRGGQLLSRDYADYELAPCQQLWKDAGTSGGDGRQAVFSLPDFRQYLVLQSCQHGSSNTVAAVQPTLVVVPVGSVQRQAEQVTLMHSDASGDTIQASAALLAVLRFCLTACFTACLTAHWPGEGSALWLRAGALKPCAPCPMLQVHRYDIHPRFGHLRARSIPARLQLAALYAATGSLLPDPVSRMTGAQQAMALLRQCWTTQPLSEGELQQLRSAACLGGKWLTAWLLTACLLETWDLITAAAWHQRNACSTYVLLPLLRLAPKLTSCLSVPSPWCLQGTWLPACGCLPMSYSAAPASSTACITRPQRHCQTTASPQHLTPSGLQLTSRSGAATAATTPACC